MKSVNLDSTNPAQQAKPPRAEPIRPGTAETGKITIVSRPADHISVSPAAVEVGRMVARAKGMDDVRHDRVQALRDLVDSGRYEPSASEIADAILRHEQ